MRACESDKCWSVEGSLSSNKQGNRGSQRDPLPKVMGQEQGARICTKFRALPSMFYKDQRDTGLSEMLIDLDARRTHGRTCRQGPTLHHALSPSSWVWSPQYIIGPSLGTPYVPGSGLGTDMNKSFCPSSRSRESDEGGRCAPKWPLASCIALGHSKGSINNMLLLPLL